jgi:hypothetical protein
VQLSGEDIYHHCQGPAEQLFGIHVLSPCTVKARISANPGVVSSYCYGQPVTLTVTTADSYAWSTGASTQSIGVIAVGSVTYTVTVTTGTCTATASYQVLGATNTPPVALCKNATVYLDSIGNARVRVNAVDGGSYSNCSGLTRSLSPNTFNCSNIGSNVVTLTVTNANHLSSSCNAMVTVIDSTAPVGRCRNASVALSASGTATVTAADIDAGSSDNCSIVSRSVSPSSFNCSNIGSNPVSLTVTTASGGHATCTATVTVTGQAMSCTASSSAGIIYLGYGAQQVTLSVNAAGAISYAWSPVTGLSCTTCAAPTFTPTAEGNYAFSLSVTNSSGCVSTCSVSVCVLDIRVPGTDGKVYICHAYSNPLLWQTLAVSVNAALAHITAHLNDHLGKCDQVCGASFKNAEEGQAVSMEMEGAESQMVVYPNPFSSDFTVTLEGFDAGCIDFKLFDVTGKLVSGLACAEAKNLLIDGNHLSKGIYLAQVQQGSLIKRARLVKAE